MKHEELPSWMALAHAAGFSNRRKMEFLIQVVHNSGISVEEALEDVRLGNAGNFDFTPKEKAGLTESIDKVPNYSFLAEELLNQYVRMISVFDPEYPDELKKNLGKLAPVLLYTKGNIELLTKESVAIVGSRKCSAQTLEFTDSIAKIMVDQGKIVVSGFAKGVDQQALSSALEHNGQSIIVLPQGIMSYSSKKYYSHIVKGDVLVLSSYHPKTPWSVGMAMDRNKTIYGLAREIYVAESDTKGGTWEGVRDGLKRGRRIYVRVPENDENNGNHLLIQSGAVAVDHAGVKVSVIHDSDSDYKRILSDEKIIEKVEKILLGNSGKGMTSSDILAVLKIGKKPQGISAILKKSAIFITEKSRGKLLFKLANTQPITKKLF
ncbi:MAG: DNA-processing protein DprA [Bacteroidales bacterium]|nr:DNA-processing protein DprA [Bacteroidales bacterium]